MELYKENQLKVYNSLTKKKEDFKTITDGYVGMYVCGPTVYSNAHLGNVRTFMFFDVVYRYLLHLGYKVRYVRNITDAGHLENDADEGEDRIAKKARLEQIEPMEVVQRYTVDFHDVLKNYNFLPPSIEPTATGHIVEQIEMIKEIIEKGFATLDFVISKKISDRVALKFSGKNLLNPKIQQTQEIKPLSGNASTEVVSSYKKGINLSLGVKINLN